MRNTLSLFTKAIEERVNVNVVTIQMVTLVFASLSVKCETSKLSHFLNASYKIYVQVNDMYLRLPTVV